MTGKTTLTFCTLIRRLIAPAMIILYIASICPAASDSELEVMRQEMRELKLMVQQLSGEVRELKSEKTQQQTSQNNYQEQISDLRADVTKINNSTSLKFQSAMDKLSLGGYGEIHGNFNEDTGKDLIDIHRLVMYLGYDFSDWIKLHTETEIEHAFINDGDGEISIEQAYVDFLLSDKFNIRAGRILTPLGIINQNHEPTLFNGVERPNFAKYVIPSTWSSDGVGIFGSLNPSLTYEAYVVGGLDGSLFTETGGIRNGRIKERPSLNDPAVTGRLDYYPSCDSDQSLRFGLSGYYGGLNNGNNGTNPGVSGDIAITSADFEYSVSKFDFRGAIAHENISGARELGAAGQDIAEEIFGWYLEGGYHFWPDEWKKGKLAESDAVAFVRFDSFDTQHKMPSGIARNRAADREEWTLGVNFYPVPNFVVKADYQIRSDDASGSNLSNLFNVGIGWTF